MTGMALAAGLGALGGAMEDKAADDALGNAINAAGYSGTGVSGNLGEVLYNDNGGYQLNLTPEQQAIQSALQGGILGQLGGGGFGGVINSLGGLFGSGDMTNAWQGLQAQLGQDANPFFQQAIGNMQGAQGFAQGAGMQGLLGGMAGLNPQQAFNQAGGFFGQAQNLMGQAGDVQGLINDRYNALSQAAAPGEERAYNSLQQKLFSQGRLGSTGGSRDIEAFARGLGQADLSRQMEAQNLGLATQGQLMNQAAQFGGLGSSLLGQGYGAAGQLGSLGQGMFGMGNDLTNQLLSTQLGQQDYGISRAGQRMASMTDLLGLGQGFQGTNLSNALMGIQGLTGLEGSIQNLLGLSIDASRARATAGGNQAGYLAEQKGSGGILGGLLGGLGGMFSDERLKKNIIRVGYDYLRNLPIYIWNWNEEGKRLGGGPTIGYIAQQVQKLYPQAVTTEEGYLKINMAGVR